MTEQMTEETILEQGKVTVTTSRLVIGAKTYSMSNITSVTFGKIPPNKLTGVIFIGLGVILLVMFAGAFESILAGLILGGGTIAAGVFLFTRAKPTYTVRLGSASGESDALSSKDEERIRNIVNAINEAIIKRG